MQWLGHKQWCSAAWRVLHVLGVQWLHRDAQSECAIAKSFKIRNGFDDFTALLG